MEDRVEVEVFYEGELVSRKEAVERGLKNYFTGKPCKHGHVAQRRSGSGSCSQCCTTATKSWREASKTKGNSEKYNHKPTPSVEEIQKVLDYNPDTGIFTWKYRPEEDFPSYRIYRSWNGKFKGKEAGAKHYSNGYIEIRFVDKKLYKAHRLAWKIMTGQDAEGIVDHKNTITWDNRWDNLREATHQDNSRNMKIKPEKNFKGITLCKNGEWQASICVSDESIILGRFSSKEVAARAYDAKAKDLFGEFANLNYPEEE